MPGLVRIVVIVLAFLLAADGSWAQEPRRVALVIANSNYVHAGRLANPANDARVVAEALAKAGFQTIVVKHNLPHRDFLVALRDFKAKATGAEVALVYFAGHGIEGRGRNWLIPVDAELSAESNLDFEAVALDSVLGVVEDADLKIVILDACRNNPFGQAWLRGTRSVSFGLRVMEPDIEGTLIMYAAAAGSVASDGKGGNSPFAIALSRRLQEPGLSILTLGPAVRDDVLASTSNNQKPFIYSSLSARSFYLISPVSQPSPGPLFSPADKTALLLGHDRAAFNAALADGTEEGLLRYLSRDNPYSSSEAEEVLGESVRRRERLARAPVTDPRFVFTFATPDPYHLDAAQRQRGAALGKELGSLAGRPLVMIKSYWRGARDGASENHGSNMQVSEVANLLLDGGLDPRQLVTIPMQDVEDPWARSGQQLGSPGVEISGVTVIEIVPRLTDCVQGGTACDS